MDGDLIAGMAIALIFGGIPITGMVTYHQRKMAEIKARMGGVEATEIKEQVTAMRKDMAELRDTATRFDVSFDAAITRLEQRMDRAETTLSKVAPQTTLVQPEAEQEDVTLQLRR